MSEQAAQAIDDGEAEAEATAKPPTVALRIVKPVELAEYLLALIVWNAGPCIPNFDAQIWATLTAADQDTSTGDVSDRIGNQIEKDLLQEHEVTANPRLCWNDSKVQFDLLGDPCEGRLDPLEQSGDRKFGDARRQRAGI